MPIASLHKELNMDLALTETQEEFKKVAEDFVKAEVPAHQMTQWYKNKQTFRPELIKKAAEIGWLGMMLAGRVRRRGRVHDGLRRGVRSARARTCARTAFHFRRAERADDFRSLHRRTKKDVAAKDLRRLGDRRARHHRQSRLLGARSGGDAPIESERRLPHERRQALRLRR